MIARMNALLSPATAVATATANSTSTVTPGAQRSRTGKIARLPRAIRQRLNERLADGEPQHLLVAWLSEQEGVRDRLLLARTEGAGGAGAGRREESAGVSRSQREDSADGNDDSGGLLRALAGGGSRGCRSRVVVANRA